MKDLFGEDVEEDGSDVSGLAEALVNRGNTIADPESAPDRYDKSAGVPMSEYVRSSMFEHDPVVPLADPRDERFIAEYIASGNGQVAYMRSHSARCTVVTARSQASRLLRRPDVRGRLQWLQREQWQAQKRDEREGKVGDLDSEITDEEMLRLCARLIRDKTCPLSDRVRAMEVRNKIVDRRKAGEQASKAVDPTMLMEYFRQAQEQGRDPREGLPAPAEPTEKRVCGNSPKDGNWSGNTTMGGGLDESTNEPKTKVL